MDPAVASEMWLGKDQRGLGKAVSSQEVFGSMVGIFITYGFV